MTQSPTLAAALALASIGIHVFPCKVRAKEPATPHGFKDASVDPEQIARWWSVEPNFNIGAATGKNSGLVVLDIDGADGEAALRKLECKHGDLPPTWETVTPRGRHVGFEYPGRPVRNSASKVAPGIDVRGDGGYVLCAPSVHPCGAKYEWGVDCADTIATAPDWLVELMAAPADGVATVMPPDEWADLIAAGISEGARNCTLARLAGHLLRRRIDPYVTLELLRVWNQVRCRPPLSDSVVERTVGSIAACELRRRGDE